MSEQPTDSRAARIAELETLGAKDETGAVARLGKHAAIVVLQDAIGELAKLAREHNQPLPSGFTYGDQPDADGPDEGFRANG